MKRVLFIAVSFSALSACNLAPAYNRPEPLVAAAFPSGPAYAPQSEARLQASWRSLFSDKRLQTLIARAVSDNRSLRQSLAQVEGARALYRVQRSAQSPTPAGGVSSSFNGGAAAVQGDESHQASLSLASFEIDLFGRLRNESASAFEAYLATEAGARSAHVALVAETASAWLSLAADQDRLRLAQDTAASAERSLELTRTLNARGLVSRLDVVSADQILQQARADIANFTRQVAQDRNALVLLVGGPVEDALLPPSLMELDDAIGVPAAGLTSAVLLERPDVLQAEHQLKAAHADIGAARAALFPAISLTALAGVISPSLSDLFSDGQETWSASPSATVPIFAPGTRSNVAYTEAQRDAAVAGYQFVVQTAFREVADALARDGTIAAQRAAQTALVAAAAESLRLGEARYRAGVDDYLTTLTAQRSTYAARQGALAVVLEDVLNRVTLYQVLGGSVVDWDPDRQIGGGLP
jgi:multidrug efflux system outer membrane protein